MLLNDKRIFPAYTNNDLQITGTNMIITLIIPALDTKIVFGVSNGGSHFSIDLSPLFSGTTEGLCGELL